MSDAAPPEEPKLEIHKPPRAWRGYLKEYVIIVVGVLTALAAQQAAEALRDRNRATEARASIRAEIARNLAYMNARNANEACVSRRLDEVDGLIAASAAGKLPPAPIWIGQALGLIMHDGNYQAAAQSGGVSLFSREEQAVYTDLYAMFGTYWQHAVLERAAWADLRTLEQHPLPSAVLDWQLRSAMQKARSARWGLQLTRAVAIRDAAEIGITPAISEAIRLSACMPLHTPRAEALKAMAAQAPFRLDEP
jgi:hypothetical protein